MDTVSDDDAQLHPGGAPALSTSRPTGPVGSVGLVLDGRYRLQRRRSRDGASSTWDARDDSLDRSVSVRLVPGPTALEAVDAARRAAAVDDVRLPRVLDVGTSRTDDGGPLGWVVTEVPAGRPLLDVVREAPLPAERVRAVVGEAAGVLARASAAGLHHRRLDPSSVVLGPEGAVSVVGLEVAAAAAGLEPVTAAQAEREDALGLVSLLYAGLTGLWPHGRFSALGAAPTAGRSPVPPADLVPGVPNDLDTLAAVTLGPYEDGPRSPRELAEELAPWDTGAGAVDAADGVVRLPSDARPSPAPAAPAVLARAAVPTGQWRTSRAPDEDDPFALVGLAGAQDPVPDESAAPVERRTGRLVLAAVGAVLVVLLALAAANLPSLGGVLGIAPSSDTGSDTGSDAVAGAEPPSAAEPEAPPAPPAPPEPVAVVDAVAVDPLGDDSENDEQAPRALDGDPSTAWTTETYGSAELGGLKDGVGLALDLGGAATVSRVELSVAGTGGVLEVRTSPDGGFEDSTVVAGAQLDGEEPAAVELPEPVEARWLLLWFTELPEVDDGYRAEVSGVGVG